MNEDVYKLSPAWDSSGNYPYHFINDRSGLFEIARFDTVEPLLPSWRSPSLHISHHGMEADVYFCTAGYFFFGYRARNALADVLGAAVEWLPLEVQNLGDLWILHPLQALQLGDGAEFRQNEVSKNITEISRYTFAPSEASFPPAFFVEQALDSAARQAGFVYPAIHLTGPVNSAIERCDLSGIRGEKIVTKEPNKARHSNPH